MNALDKLKIRLAREEQNVRVAFPHEMTPSEFIEEAFAFGATQQVSLFLDCNWY